MLGPIRIRPAVHESQMDIREDIRALFREIEVYRSHSLFEEAVVKCQWLGKLIGENDRIKNKQELLNIVAEKIRDLEENARRVGEEAASAQMSKREQALAKKLFAAPKKGDDDSAAMEGAIALLVFRQFRRALSEFNALIKKKELRVAAAKNMIRCHVGLSSLDDAVKQYEQWLAKGWFPLKEMENIRSFLQDILKKKGVEKVLSKPQQQSAAVVVKIRPKLQEAAAAAQFPPEPEGADPVPDQAPQKLEKLPNGEFIDILNIQLPLKGESGDGEHIQLDVGYQRGNWISVIIPRESQALVDQFKTGLRIDGAQFYSPSVLFSSSCVISDIKQIDAGPRKGGYALLLKILNS